MITEVQLTNNRLHFLYLQRVISTMAGSAGMDCQDTEDMGKAVTEMCLSSLNVISESPNSTLSVILATDPSRMTVDIVSENASVQHAFSKDGFDGNYSQRMEIAKGLVNSVEFLPSSGTTIRLTKQVTGFNPLIDFPNPEISALEATASIS